MSSLPDVTREEAQSAEQAARRAAAEAEEATRDAEARRKAAEQAAKDAMEQRQRFEQYMRGIELNAAKELRTFQAEVDKLLAANSRWPPSNPSADTRGMARKYLHGGLEVDELDWLARSDGRTGELLGKQRAAGQMMGNLAAADIVDPGLNQLADAIECKCWRALLARVQVVAGESEA